MRHHYVPQFLLRPWAEPSADHKVQVFRLDLQRLTSSRLAPKNTGYEQGLYALTMPIVAGMEQHAVEKNLLRHIDNHGARVRRILEEHGFQSLTPEDRMDWARFLMALRIRQPDVIDMLKVQSSDHLRRTLQIQPEQYEELTDAADPPTLEEWVEKNFPGLIANFGLSFVHELVDNANIGTKIVKMKWWLWDFSDARHELLLSDHPCIFTTGIDDPNLIVALPIGPRKAFMATQSDRATELMRRQVAKDLARRLNESSVAQARTRIYATDGSAERFIQNRLSRRRAIKKERP